MNPTDRVITWDELSQHAVRHSLWIAIEGQVFDVTTYLAEHPGGDDILVKYGGNDATAAFLKQKHTKYAVSLRDARLVGQLTKEKKPNDYDKSVKKSSINPNQVYTWEQVAAHNNKEDLWIVIDGKIYDVTDFQNDHPGGPAVLAGKAGDDASSAFHESNHSKNAKEQLKGFQVGVVTGIKPKQSGDGSNATMILYFILFLALVGGFLYLRQ